MVDGGNDFVEERLDRACVNNEWSSIFPRAKASHLDVSYSDHDPIQLSLGTLGPQPARQKKIQRFEEKWVAHVECEKRIQTSWT